MDANDVAMARRLATDRVLLRRRPPTERIQRGRTPDSDLTVTEVVGSAFLEPTSVSEWVDDLLSVHGYGQMRGPWVPSSPRSSSTAAPASATLPPR